MNWFTVSKYIAGCILLVSVPAVADSQLCATLQSTPMDILRPLWQGNFIALPQQSTKNQPSLYGQDEQSDPSSRAPSKEEMKAFMPPLDHNKPLPKEEPHKWIGGLPLPAYGEPVRVKSARAYSVCDSNDAIDQMLCDFNKDAIKRGSNVRASSFGVDFQTAFSFQLQRGMYSYVPTNKYARDAYLGTMQRLLPKNAVQNLGTPTNESVFGEGLVCDDANNCHIAGSIEVTGINPALKNQLQAESLRYSWPIQLDGYAFGIAFISPRYKEIFGVRYVPRPYAPNLDDPFTDYRDYFEAQPVCNN